ncbi:MAG: T9SS type A sorting domain-containing protein [Chitinophagaceae bacterium]
MTNGNFRVTFPDNEYGQYSIQQIDLTGKIVSQKRVTVNMKAQTEEVKIGTQLTSGSYLVRIVNGSKNVASTNTLLLE